MISRADKESSLVFTHQQILHFSTFGYLTLRGLFSQPKMAALRDEVTSALPDAFGQTGPTRPRLGSLSRTGRNGRTSWSRPSRATRPSFTRTCSTAHAAARRG
jgi:hypothetical protein